MNCNNAQKDMEKNYNYRQLYLSNPYAKIKMEKGERRSVIQNSDAMNSNEIKIKSLKKALDVLNCFVVKPTWGVTEISERLGLNKSNVHDILTTLKAMDYLERDAETDRYKLGMQIFALNRAMGDTFSIIKIAQPYMQEVANITDERVYLAIPHEGEVVYLEASYPAESINLMRSILGERAEMHCTGIGKAMLSNLPEEDIAKYLEKTLSAYTEETITDSEVLKKELEITRQRGYAIDNMEHEFGVKCVALPIFDKSRKLYAAMSVSGLAPHFTDEKIKEWAILLKKYVAKIENRL